MVTMGAAHTVTLSLQAYPTQRIPHSLDLPAQTMLTVLLIFCISLVAIMSSQLSIAHPDDAYAFSR